MILPIIDGWRLFAVQQLGLVIRISSKLMTAGTLFFFFEGQSLIKLNICNPYVGTCGLQQGGFFLCCWYDMHQRLINITQGGEELNRNKNVYTLRGKGWKIQRNLMYFNYIQEPYFLAVKMFVCRTMFWRERFLNPRFETTSWSQHRQEPIPL